MNNIYGNPEIATHVANKRQFTCSWCGKKTKGTKFRLKASRKHVCSCVIEPGWYGRYVAALGAAVVVK